MKKLALMSLLFVSTLLSAQEPIKIKLWQNGAPNDNGMTGQVENGPLYVAEPTIEVYPAKESNGLAIVMCPGGGYGHLAMAHEGHDMASWFNSQGITYAVLTYRMPNGNNEVPLSDAQQALRIMRQHAKEWNIQKLGIMGASAGGHLASTAATHFTDAETDLYPHGLARQPVRQESIKGTRTEVFERIASHSRDASSLHHAQQQ